MNDCKANPYLLDTPAVISFSGGRTSGFMLWHCIQAFGGKLPEGVKVIFCNTGKERPETLDFVQRCAAEWGVEVIWLEYRYVAPVPCPTRDPDWATLDDAPEGERTRRWDAWHKIIAPLRRAKAKEAIEEAARRKTLKRKDRKGLPRISKGIGQHTFVRVDFETASRHGEPLEEAIAARNMLPNVMARFCTVEGKIRTTQRYLKAAGWTHWTNAIGFRADEPHRVAKLGGTPIGANRSHGTNRHANEEPVAPMFKDGISKADVMEWWNRQPFKLELMDHEGNCDLCFLKGANKIRRVMQDAPSHADWWIRMEAAAVSRGLARNRSVAFFRKDRPRYRVQLQMAQRPGLFDTNEADELSIACHCTD